MVIIVHVKSDAGITPGNENCKWLLLTAKVPTLAVASCNITIPKKSGKKYKKSALSLMNKFQSAHRFEGFSQDILLLPTTSLIFDDN